MREPYETKARFNGKCPACGRPVRRGDRLVIWPTAPRGKRARCWKCSEGPYLEALAERMRDRYGGP